ncbi:MAG: cation:proton antiporter [Planctomycetota bacterium]|nr:cation:proton antiporter [Planctomycetota bacterium]
MHASLLKDIGFCIVAATILAHFARATRQPLVLAYIIAGVLIGPLMLGVVSDEESIRSLAELGVAFLLFIVGLELDARNLGAISAKALPVTIVQVAIGAVMGWGVGWLFGFTGLAAVYIGGAVAFSSTMIALKLLSDRGEMTSSHGQVILGVLLLQDVAAIGMLAVQPNIGGEGVSPIVLALAATKGMGLLAGAILLSRYVLPLFFGWVAKSPEVMLLSALSWCFIVCYAADRLGFSIAMGALIAGVSLSAFPYALDVVAKIRGLRTFFVTLFFVSLGMLLQRPTPKMMLAAVALSIVVIVSRFITVWPVMRLRGYSGRAGVLTSIYLSQISEFGLVLVLVGISFDPPHIGPDIVSLVVILLIITSTASTYMIEYSHVIAGWFVAPPSAHQGDSDKSTALVRDDQAIPVMLVGCFRNGSSLIHELRQAAIDFAVVDFDQAVNNRLNRLGVNTVYGDVSHHDTLEHSGIERARILIVPLDDDSLRGTDNATLLRSLRKLNPTAKIILTAHAMSQASRLYAEGTDYVLLPRVLVARHLMEIIAEIGAGEIEGRRQLEMEHIPTRVEVVP